MNYLSTKPNKITKEFPKKPKISEVISFLKTKGFSEVNLKTDDYGLYELLDYISKYAMNNDTDGYIISSNTYDKDNHRWIRFWRYGHIDKDNAIYFLKITDDGHIVPNTFSCLAAIEGSNGRIKKIDSYYAFKDLMDKYYFK